MKDWNIFDQQHTLIKLDAWTDLNILDETQTPTRIFPTLHKQDLRYFERWCRRAWYHGVASMWYGMVMWQVCGMVWWCGRVWEHFKFSIGTSFCYYGLVENGRNMPKWRVLYSVKVVSSSLSTTNCRFNGHIRQFSHYRTMQNDIISSFWD